jgi:hypothetical protein
VAATFPVISGNKVCLSYRSNAVHNPRVAIIGFYESLYQLENISQTTVYTEEALEATHHANMGKKFNRLFCHPEDVSF